MSTSKNVGFFAAATAAVALMFAVPASAATPTTQPVKHKHHVSKTVQKTSAPVAAATPAPNALPDGLIDVGTPGHPMFVHDHNNGAYQNYTENAIPPQMQ
ncbi:hypothetical protein [Segnochrobactrum spirostomi]|uniref:Secreted protein n=1 Tax=Segnochrobactrum spirostomi TaxID=2608987 RepID=A0A6A7Y5J4_9HYPH|nr:hypothetical protein [Segnochrobactrum spirostomi]MQT14464.1 hypothetical protein [Segnochrobactrum spirostomi]